MENKTLTIQVNQEVTLEHFETIIVGALEGGSNYWYCLGEGIPPRDENHSPLSTRVAHKLFNDPTYQLQIMDLEDEEREVLGYVTQESMLNAFHIIAKQYPWHYSNLIGENDDAETADVFFQVATMGEIVFG
jgi:hypothetical protein